MTSNKMLVLNIVVTLVLVGGLATGFYLVRQRQLTQTQAKFTELQVLPVNVTDTSLGVWFRTDRPTSGCVSLTDIDSNQTFNQCDPVKSQVHQINISRLTPQAKYQIRVTANNQLVVLSPFFGAYTQTAANNIFRTPQPVTGIISTSLGKPVIGATVFISLNLSDQFRFPLAVLTDKNGTFTVDLSGFIYSPPATYDSYFMEVTDSSGRKLVETTKTVSEVNQGGFNLNIP